MTHGFCDPYKISQITSVKCVDHDTASCLDITDSKQIQAMMRYTGHLFYDSIVPCLPYCLCLGAAVCMHVYGFGVCASKSILPEIESKDKYVS